MNAGNVVPGDIAHAIQLALAPVFLLTGIAGLLNVMAARLSRIIDRGRQLTEGGRGDRYTAERLALDLRGLERRRHLASAAITSCTVSALLVCVVIAMLFLEAFLHLPLRWLEGLHFTAATVALVAGLAFFLAEIHLATRTVRIELQATSVPPPQAPPS